MADTKQRIRQKIDQGAENREENQEEATAPPRLLVTNNHLPERFRSLDRHLFEFFGGSSRMNDQETSAVWALSQWTKETALGPIFDF